MTDAEKDFQDWAFAHRDDAKRDGWTIQFYSNPQGPGWWRLSSFGSRFNTVLDAWHHVIFTCGHKPASRAALEFLAKHSPRLFIEHAGNEQHMMRVVPRLEELVVTAHLRV